MKNIEDYIRNWAKTVKKDYGMILESNTPSDIETLKASFPKDVSNEKMVPTEEFLETAYTIMNEEFFGNQLPNKLLFRIKSLPGRSFIGFASYTIYRYEHRLEPTSITLNSSRTLTLHEWLEVVMHEMVHVVDYINYPERYMNKRTYDPHGSWFLSYGKQFEEYGFNVQKYCKADIGINMDNSRVKNRFGNTSFIVLDGYNTGTGKTAITVVPTKDIEKYINIFTNKFSRGKLNGLKKVIVMKSENPNIVSLKQMRMRNEYGTLSWYYYTEDFKKNYGPFEEVKTYNVLSSSNKMNEDKDEVDYDEMNHIDDDYAKHIYDTIEDVVNVRKIDDNSYEVSIF